MGEKIRVLSQGKIFEKNFEIELNKPHLPTMPNDIHIQSSNFRYQINEKEFINLALTVLRSRRHLVAMKGLEEDV